MLTRRTGPEIAIGDENGCALLFLFVKRVNAPRALRFQTIVLEDVCVESLERDRLQETGRHDSIRVDVLAAERQRPSLDDLNLLGAHHRTPAATSSSSSRTSVTS